MKASDFIIEYLIRAGVTDLFGYPGGVVCHLIDSAHKYKDKISAHISYHEQGAAMAACGYAQVKNAVGVAYATSGPGALNLVTGIANAYFDGIPVLFLTGQVDTYASKGSRHIRQRGFQETDIVAVATPITKSALYVDAAAKLPDVLKQSLKTAVSGRPGPVLLDLPADVQRADVPDALVKKSFAEIGSISLAYDNTKTQIAATQIVDALQCAKRPCIIAGAGILQSGMREHFQTLCEKWEIPAVLTMNAMGLLPFSHQCQFGFIGANGHRSANQIMAKSDLIISLGARLDLKQVGNNRETFLPEARLIRVDVDEGELGYPVRKDEIQVCADLNQLIPYLLEQEVVKGSIEWLQTCHHLKRLLYTYDHDVARHFIEEISRFIPNTCNIVTDCGQNQLWTLQAFCVKEHQKVFTTGGLGAMGYALPAAIGMYYGDRKPVVAFAGDGGIQMNIQELQFMSREELPIKIVILNNHSLGMIRHFQEMNFEKNYYQTTAESGYTAPDFCSIAAGYRIPYYQVSSLNDIPQIGWSNGGAGIIEVVLPTETYLLPRFGKKNGFSDAEPILTGELAELVERL